MLTREDELDLARTIEEAELSALRALYASIHARQRLRLLAQDLRSGKVRARELLRNLEEGMEDDHGARLVAILEKAEPDEAELLQVRLEPHVLDRIAHELDQLAGDDPTVKQTLSSVDRQRRRADRARSTFVSANRGLVVLLAKRHLDQGLELSDLVQEGNLGLLRAIDKFDHRLGHRFSTYAAWWVRHALARAIANQASTIRVPVHLLESRRKLRRVRQLLSGEASREPTEEELEQASGLGPDKIRAVMELVREPLRLETPVGEEGDATLGSLVADPNAPRPDDEVADARMRAQIRSLLETLTPREQIVLRKRFGIDETDRTLAEVGKSFGLSRERVRQIETNALRKLRKASERLELGLHLQGG